MAVRSRLLAAVATLLASSTSAVHIIDVDCEATTGTRTLSAAQQLVRQLQPLNSSVEVHISGDCLVDAALLQLDGARDSGVYPHTVTYRQSPSGKQARLLGGVPLAASGFRPAASPVLPPASAAHVVQYDLSGVDFGPQGIGQFSSGALGQCTQTRVELFFKGAPMQLARYPNAPLGGVPWMEWLTVSAANLPGAEDAAGARLPPCGRDDFGAAAVGRARCRKTQAATTTAFGVDDAAGVLGSRFAAEVAAKGSDVWLHGFWGYDWADNYIKLEAANETNLSAHEWKFTYSAETTPIYGMHKSARFYIVNSLAELDSPGEYYIDSTTLTLYFYPPEPITADSDIFVSTVPLATPTALVSSTAASTLHDVRFEGLAILYARYGGISFADAQRVSVTDVVVAGVGREAVSVANGQSVAIRNVAASGIGCIGIHVAGGDPATLVPGNVTVEDSSVHDFARWTRTYNPGVSFGGVGVTVQTTTIGNAPHQGISGSGNDHRFLDNHLHNLCYEVRDSSAFYVGRSYIHRGLLLAGNTFTNITSVEPTHLGSGFVYAMYFDDEQCGVTATNNLCSHVDFCFLVGGGRNNRLTGNRAEHTHGFMKFDNRGLGWQAAFCKSEFPKQLQSVNYTQPPYSIEYPAIVNSLTYRPCTPVQNSFIGNTYCDTPLFSATTDATIKEWGSYASGNTEDAAC